MRTDEIFEDTCAAARRHHPQLKPFLTDGESMRRAAASMSHDALPPGRTIVDPHTEDRDLRLMASGSAVNVLQAPGRVPETVRDLKPPGAFHTNTFALGQARRTAILTTASSTVLRISPRGFRKISMDTPMIAVALLRWAAMDLVDGIREHRSGSNAWAIRYGWRGSPEHVFETASAGRQPVELDPGTRDAAAEGLRSVRCFQSVSLHPLANGLGTHVHLVTVPEGEPIVAHGELDGHVYLLLEGEAEMFGASGYSLARFRGGGGAQEVIIGEVSFLAQGGRVGTVTATTDCLLLQIPRDAVLWMLRHHPVLAVTLHKALLRTLCWRMLEADDEREQLVAALAGTVVPPPRR
ncbi:MAG: cyclic nucleotide-binding domain-containing protein [Myxococcota bacterium]